MNIHVLRITFCFIFLFGKICFSQTLFSNIKYQIEAGNYLSTSTITPFWLRSNQYGIVPLKPPILTFRGSAYKEYDSTMNKNQKLKKFGVGYGFWGVANVGKQSGLLLPEAYIKVHYGAFEFYGGRRREIVGLVDTTLSSGSYIWSGNALPIPKIQISFPNYTSIIGHGLVSIKGSYSHGWFGKQNYLKNVFLHQKAFYLRIGKPEWKIKMYTGFNHQVMWGGESNNVDFKSIKNNRPPSSFNDYLYLVSGITLNLPYRQAKLDTNNYTYYDLTNRIGNHVGSIDIAGTIDINKTKIYLYRQSFYDDGSLFFLGNISDGLNGITISGKYKVSKKIILEQVNFELFNSSNQGSRFGPDQTINSLRGRDDYFNHGQFIDGWSYKGQAIGTPFIMPYTNINSSLPQNINDYFTKNSVSFFTNNNRIVYKSISIKGSYKSLYLTFKLSNSRNYGTYFAPFPSKINQLSSVINLEYLIKAQNLFLSGSFAFDRGNLFQNSQGVRILVRKLWD